MVANNLRERMTFTHAAILTLREFDREHPDFSEEKKDQLTDTAETLARLENSDEVQRHHLQDALDVVHHGKTIMYCPTCRSYALSVFRTGYRSYCGGHGCHRERLHLAVIGGAR